MGTTPGQSTWDKKRRIMNGTHLLHESLILGFFHESVCFLLLFWLLGEWEEVGVAGELRKEELVSVWNWLGNLRAYPRLRSPELVGVSAEMMFSELELRVAKGTRLEEEKRKLIECLLLKVFWSLPRIRAGQLNVGKGNSFQVFTLLQVGINCVEVTIDILKWNKIEF